MKKIFFTLFIFLAAFEIYASPVLKMFSGDVSVKAPGKSDWQAAYRGIILNDGWQVKTGRASYASIDLDGDEIRVSQNSLIEITTDMVDEKPTGFMSLFSGKLSLKLAKLKKGNQSYGIRTPSAVAAVRGTEFDIAAGADGMTIVQVTEGKVSLTGKSNTVLIGANQESSVAIGKDPEAVKTLRPREWDSWLEESSKNLKGNELKLMKVLLENVKRLDSEISGMEKQRSVLDSESAVFAAKAEEFKKSGDDVNWEKNVRLSRDRARKASLFFKKSFYQAGRIDFISKYASKLYNDSPDKKSLEPDLKKIKSVHEKYYLKYIKQIEEEQIRRENEKVNSRKSGSGSGACIM